MPLVTGRQSESMLAAQDVKHPRSGLAGFLKPRHDPLIAHLVGDEVLVLEMPVRLRDVDDQLPESPITQFDRQDGAPFPGSHPPGQHDPRQ